jgi:hypothetical protein
MRNAILIQIIMLKFLGLRLIIGSRTRWHDRQASGFELSPPMIISKEYANHQPLVASRSVGLEDNVHRIYEDYSTTYFINTSNISIITATFHYLKHLQPVTEGHREMLCCMAIF